MDGFKRYQIYQDTKHQIKTIGFNKMMKDLGEKLRSGGVQKFNGEQLGINRQGKGSFPRTQPTNKKWQENWDKIFGKKNSGSSNKTKDHYSYFGDDEDV